jgi:hypothetical protein
MPKDKVPGPGNGDGLCACGCGLPTTIARRNRPERGIVSGFPNKWRSGHYSRRPTYPAVDNKKRCARCLRVRPISDFPLALGRPDGVVPYCAPCRRDQERKRRYRVENRRAERRRARKRSLAAHGLTEEQYAALLARQGGGCAICGSRHPKQAGIEHFHVDHCHASGGVRGLLCRTCNTGLGMFADDPERLRCAADYLAASERPRAPGRAPSA